jgi:hypothetical protein
MRVDWLTAKQFKIILKKLRQRKELKLNLVNHPPGIFTQHNHLADPACSSHDKCLAAEKVLVKRGWGDDQVKADMASCDGPLDRLSLPLRAHANTIFFGFSTQCTLIYLQHFDSWTREAHKELVRAAILGIKQTIWPMQYNAEPSVVTSDSAFTTPPTNYPFVDWLHEYPN